MFKTGTVSDRLLSPNFDDNDDNDNYDTNDDNDNYDTNSNNDDNNYYEPAGYDNNNCYKV